MRRQQASRSPFARTMSTSPGRYGDACNSWSCLAQLPREGIDPLEGDGSRPGPRGLAHGTRAAVRGAAPQVPSRMARFTCRISWHTSRVTAARLLAEAMQLSEEDREELAA